MAIAMGLLSLAVSAGLVALDQIIKWWATTSLQPVGSMPLLPGIVELRYVLNDGMAFSLLQGKQTFLIVVTAIALLVLLVILFKKLSNCERVAWTLIFAGGVGNLIDRVLNGQVVDYVNALFINFAVFNFADICVTFGVVFLLVALFAELRQEKKAKAAAVNRAPDQGAPEERAQGAAEQAAEQKNDGNA